jgi:hypothetical protein
VSHCTDLSKLNDVQLLVYVCVRSDICSVVFCRAVESESESEGILGGVGAGKNVATPTLQSKILTTYSNSRALIATVTIRHT